MLLLSRMALCAGLALFFSTALLAQSESDRVPREVALKFLRANPVALGLSAQDVADIRVADDYKTEGLGLTHVWLQQQWAGIPVFNALFGLHVKTNGEVVHLGHRFTANLKSRINTTMPSLSAQKALEMAMLHLGFSGFDVPGVHQKINDKNWVFRGEAISRNNIPVSICYEQMPDGRLRLAWTMVIDQANTSDLWNLRVDAQTGEIIGKINQTSYCKAGHAEEVESLKVRSSKFGDQPEAGVPGADFSNFDFQRTTPSTLPNPKTKAQTSNFELQTSNSELPTSNFELKKLNGDGASYRVFALPVESPAHGARTLVTDPADATASPFGWHDTNGAAGPEYSYTRGNNVFSYEDIDGNNNPPANPGPSGGATLKFDSPFNPAAEPIGNQDAAITNLFYINNMMHDIAYRYGFTESARNFQVNNYGKGGIANDAVLAEAMDGSGENNANFSTPSDGSSGRMQMYRWARQGGKILTANAPVGIVGKYFAAAASGWGMAITTTPVTGDVQIVNDGSSNPTWSCFPLVESVAGKIALIDRKSCEFGEKALNAQKAGAIACIICNFQEGTINMGAGAMGVQVTIPVVMMQKSDCDLLRQFAGSGLNVSLALDAAVSGPNFLDGDFDNGIIAHEYGHGISNRLTGNGSSCLGNAEQMGEGWSDFFTLAITANPGDTGAKRQGVGTYVISQENDGTGIRRSPYTTDMNISPNVYSTVAENTQTHAVGEVWTSMLWDFYWAMADQYGFDADLSNTNSGNGRALQLVMDGMKLQPCNPGFQDGRDAIIAADKARYGGADTCLIMSAFARRGLGYYSSQGLSNNASDGKENFDPIPYCVKNLKITKTTSTPTITAGEEVSFSIKVANHKDEEAANVKVTDELQASLTFVSASDGGKLENGFVVWDLGAMPSLTTKTLTYKAKSASNIGCDVLFNDDMEIPDDWYPLTSKGNQAFVFQSNVVKTGGSAWLAEGSNAVNDLALEGLAPIAVQGGNPHLRFWHQYDTEIGTDAGFLEIQENGQNGWTSLTAAQAVRHPYSTKIPYGTFALPSLSGFSGKSGGWVQSYFDLKKWAGKTIFIRFRLGTNADGTGGAPIAKWYIDDLEQINLVNFDGEACVTYAGGTSACAKAPESGVIVNRNATSSTPETAANSLALFVQPNPASDLLNVTLGQSVSGPVRCSLIGADGRIAFREERDTYVSGQVLTFGLQQLPKGVYLLRVETNAGSGVEKVVIR